MHVGTFDRWLARVARNWFGFVDTNSSARELMPKIDADGHWVSPIDGQPMPEDAKANKWKNGYHGVEHALVLYLHGHWRHATTATLYFAPRGGCGAGPPGLA